MKLLLLLLLLLLLSLYFVNGCGDLCALDLPGIIAYQGYPVEKHSVIPDDNKVTLNMYRIVNNNKPIVFLQHGLLDSGTTWILNPPQESLGFILYNAGYDVWIGNNRGNTYSPCQTDSCWHFSYDEMALYDLPAQVNYILNYTGHNTLSYVGHSEGTTQAFASFSLLPEISEKINLFVALAPAALVNHQKSPLVNILVDLDVVKIFEFFGAEKFLPTSWLEREVAKIFCNGGIITEFCEDIIFALCGTDPSKDHDFNMTRADVYLTHTPAGTSVQNMAHWAQAVKSSKFQMYDYGSEGNMDHYGQNTPPIYPLGNITVPTAIFSGGMDYLADPIDVEELMTLLPQKIQIFKNYQEDYSHLDFVWAMDASKKIYPSIVQLLNKYSKI